MAEQATTAGVPTFELRHRLDRALEWGGVTPAEMAAHLAVHEKTIGNYRAGRTTPSRATLVVWALRCGVPFEWLANGEVDLTGPETDPTLGVSPSGWDGVTDLAEARSVRARRPLAMVA